MLVFPVLGVALLLTVAGCAPKPRFVEPFELTNHEWQQVYSDSAYTVSLDVANVAAGPEESSVSVWYQTRHLTMKKHEGKDWNREVIHSYLRCEPLSFKTVLMTIFLEHGEPVAQIAKSPAELSKEDWRPVIQGSVDEGSLKMACELLREKGYR